MCNVRRFYIQQLCLQGLTASPYLKPKILYKMGNLENLIKSYEHDIADLEADVKRNKDGNDTTDRLLKSWKQRLKELRSLLKDKNKTK